MGKVWSEEVKGNGIGESLTFTFQTTKEDTTDLGVTSCGIGHHGSATLFRQNARPKVIVLSVDGEPKLRLHLKDTMRLQQFEIPKLALERPSKHAITLKIMDVFPGTKFEDWIAQVYFQGTGKMR